MPDDDIDPLTGLPDDLGVDTDLGKAEQRATIRVESRRYGKPVTLVEGLDPGVVDLKELASELKRALGAGGTVDDGTIEVQGDHADRVPELLRERGYRVER